MASSLYQSNAPGRPPGPGGPPGGAFRSNAGPPGPPPLPPPPPGAYNLNPYPPLPPPPPGGYNPNPYGSAAVGPPPPPGPPPGPPPPPPYGALPPPPTGPQQLPPPPSQGPQQQLPPLPPPGSQQHLPAPPPHYPPAHPHAHSHPHSLSLSQHPHQSAHVPMNQPPYPNQGNSNQGHNIGYSSNPSLNRPNVQQGLIQPHRPSGSSHSRVLGGGNGAQERSVGGPGTSSSSRGNNTGSAAPHSRRLETPEERRERKMKEYERHKAEERHKDKSRGHPHPSSSKPGPVNGTKERDNRVERRAVPFADKVENRLKRPSTFLCKIRFRNELPDAISQPKLMHINNDKDQYTKYTITSLERNYKHKLFVEPDLGIPLDLLDLSAYNAPRVKPPMDPEDAELLLDDEVIKKEPLSLRKKDRPTDKGVAWLVKTQYISPLSLDPAKQSLTEKQAKELKEQREGERLLRDLNDRDQQIQAIEESFRVSKLPPVHQTKPELEAVEVLPLLPDFDRWGDQFVHMIFDTDPTGESAQLSKLDIEMRDEIEARAIVKSYVLPPVSEDQKPEKFVAYLVPKSEELDKDIYEGYDELQYTWVREYHWDLRADPTESTYVFCFGEDSVTYLPLPSKLILHKKKAKEGRPKEEDFDNQFPVPSRVVVERRDLMDEELRMRDEAKHSFVEGRARGAQDTGQKRRRSPEPMSTSSKRKSVREEAVLNREDVSDDEMSV